MGLEFLTASQAKIVRTTLYGDQEFTPWELELLHTPVMQRLYNLKQLGFSDKVFPDAVHSRLNHVLGVAEMAERMAKNLVQWLDKNSTAEFKYSNEQSGGSRKDWPTESIKGAALAQHVRDSIPVVRLIGFLHDLTHAAFGHTLEDEVCVFLEKHDDPPRQKRFFDALAGQLLYLWATELGTQVPDPDMFDSLAHLETQAADVKSWAEELREVLGPKQSKLLAIRLRQLEMALTLLTYIEFLHDSDQDSVPPLPSLLISDAVKVLDSSLPPLDVVLHRDAFFVDIVGNTICADLLDYARRDAHNAGLRVEFDERLIRYICNVSVDKNLSPTARPCIRLAMQFFTDKMRHDVLTEMSGILRARYLITERIIFHPTKCAAGAMLGTAIQLLGITSLPNWMQVLGDQEFLRLLIDLAQRMHTMLATPRSADASEAQPAHSGDRLTELVDSCLAVIIRECGGEAALPQAIDRIKGARVLLWRLVSRRYPKAVFRLRSGVHHSGGDNDETIAKKYTNPQTRFELEREVERICNLPPGSVVVHCPRRKMSMKVAQALVVGADLTKVAHLRDVHMVTPEPLGPYHDEIKAVEEMYRSIWQFHVFLDSSQHKKRALVEAVLKEMLQFPNDALLSKNLVVHQESETSYSLLASGLRGEYAWNRLPIVVRRLDRESSMRMRHGIGDESVHDRTLRIIREANLESDQEQSVPPARQANVVNQVIQQIGVPLAEPVSEKQQLPMFGGSSERKAE